MSAYFVSIGSNLDSANVIPKCLRLLKDSFRVSKISSVYETQPVGPSGDRVFWNLVVQIETPQDRESLDQDLKKIESALGRTRDPLNKYAPRPIDMDILPQKDYQNLPFIMIPLAEISPDEHDPETGKTFGELAEKFEAEKRNYRII